MSENVGPSPQQIAHRNELLRSTVRFARLVFGATASSVFLHRPDEDVLVLEATSEEQTDSLLGITIPSGSGIAGWVFQTSEAMLADDLDTTPQFNRDVADSTGYVPSSILAAPLEADGVTIGVLELLDPAPDRVPGLAELELATELGRQCATSLAALGFLESHTKSIDTRRLVEAITAGVANIAASADRDDADLLSAIDLLVRARLRG